MLELKKECGFFSLVFDYIFLINVWVLAEIYSAITVTMIEVSIMSWMLGKESDGKEIRPIMLAILIALPAIGIYLLLAPHPQNKILSNLIFQIGLAMTILGCLASVFGSYIFAKQNNVSPTKTSLCLTEQLLLMLVPTAIFFK